MSRSLGGKAAIAGIGQTEFSKASGRSELQLACEAVKSALDDAGLAPRDVDGMTTFTMDSSEELEVARNLGIPALRYFSRTTYGGGGACAVVMHAAMAVATGAADVVVCWRAFNERSGMRFGGPAMMGATMLPPFLDMYGPYGLLTPASWVAMQARRYMHEYGATRDHLANVAIASRKHANRNPLAAMYEKPLTRELYMNARWISEPLCLFDNCLETDGAFAVVVVSAERARDLKQPPVYVHSYAQGIPPQHQTMTNFFCEDPLAGPSHACARRLWANSDIKPADISVAQIYDAFSPLIPLSLEGYGFCKRGEGAAFTENGALEWPHGRLPTNTSGGGMSEAYVHGFNLVVEGVRQMRGTSTSQVEGATSCLVTSGEGVPTSALVLRR